MAVHVRKPRAKEAERGGNLGLHSQLAQSNIQAPDSARDPISKVQDEKSRPLVR